MYELRLLWQEVLAEIRRQSRAVVAPFTIGGKLNLGSPHIVGRLRPEHLPPSVAVPDPFVYLTDSDGAYLTDQDGAYLYEAEA